MAADLNKVSVACPNCGHAQLEPPSAYSSVCKKCRQHFRVQDALHPAPKLEVHAIEVRTIRCFQCGTELEVPRTAASTMCKRCSSHVDLTDYHVTATVSKSFRTHGRLVIDEMGYVLNTDAHVGEAVVKGQLIGKLVTEGTLEIHSTARIKGKFSAGRLLIPPGQHLCWPQIVLVHSAEIGGELVANLRASGRITLKASGRLFGDIEAAGFVVEPGAVFVGSAKVGPQIAGAP